MRIHIEADNIEELIAFSRNFIGATTAPAPFAAPEQVKKNAAKAAVKEEIKPETPSAEPEVVFQEVKAEEPKQETPAEVIKEVFEDKVQEVPEGKDITKEDVRAVFATMLKANLGQDAKLLTGKYNAKKVPDIKPEDYAAIYKEAMDLIDRQESNEKAAEEATA